MNENYSRQLKLSSIMLLLFAMLFLIGTFYDKAVAETLFFPDNTFAKLITSTGTYPLYSSQVLFLGALCEKMLHSQKNICVKTMLCFFDVIAAAYIGYAGAKSIVSSNNLGSIFPSLIENFHVIAMLVMFFEYPLFFAGYFSAGKIDDKLLAKRIVVLLIVSMTAYISMQLLKAHFNRPRYRTVVHEYSGIPFVPWYKPFTDAQKYSYVYQIDADEFLSFPSGHSLFSMLTICIFPSFTWLFPKLKGKQFHLFFIGAVFGIIIIATRMILGAHYLSDVSAGAMIGVLAAIIFSFILMHISSGNK